MLDETEKRERKGPPAIYIKLTEKAYGSIKKLAQKRNITLKTLILRALNNYIKNEEKYK